MDAAQQNQNRRSSDQSKNDRNRENRENRENDQAREKEPTPKFVYLLSMLAAVGGFLFGYDTGVISGAMLLLTQKFNLGHEWQEIIVSITVGAAALFSLIGGYLTDVFGRRPVIFLASFVFTLGAILLGAAQNRAMLVVGRFVVGAGIGLAAMTVPMYIAEAAPSHLRGRLVTMNTLFITGGQFVAGVLDGAFSYVEPDGWRYMLGLAAVPSIIQFVGFYFMPESPRWLIERGRYDVAKRVLLQIRGSREAAEREFQIVKQTFEDDERERMEKGGRFVAITMLKTPHLRRALIVGCGLQLFQQVSGINTVMYYSATIIRMAGVKSTQLAIWLPAVTAGVNFLFTFVGLYLVEKIGRRLLTLGSLFLVVLSLIVLGVGFNLMADNSPPIAPPLGPINASDRCAAARTCDACTNRPECGYCFYEQDPYPYTRGTCSPTNPDASDRATSGDCARTLDPTESLTWAYDWCPTGYAWLAILGLVLYLIAFAPGMGPMPWTINSEIYPQWARSTGNALATATNWIFNLLVSMTFLSLMEAITKQGAYYLFAGVAFVGLVFFFLFLPETKGKSLEQLESLFIQPWFTYKRNGHRSSGCFGPGIAAHAPGFHKHRRTWSPQKY
jgi:SP family myo-inositol transporter-like MFS transporter 13